MEKRFVQGVVSAWRLFCYFLLHYQCRKYSLVMRYSKYFWRRCEDFPCVFESQNLILIDLVLTYLLRLDDVIEQILVWADGGSHLPGIQRVQRLHDTTRTTGKAHRRRRECQRESVVRIKESRDNDHNWWHNIVHHVRRNICAMLGNVVWHWQVFLEEC